MIETPIFVINLEKSENRKIFMDKQLSKLSNNVVFFPAINGKDNPNYY
ncbi:glycosyltransferase family 25 protein, partial [Glaesserella parasuis]|nr:glycosyltransferase family 25 protein [Glaesserella parasuis]